MNHRHPAVVEEADHRLVQDRSAHLTHDLVDLLDLHPRRQAEHEGVPGDRSELQMPVVADDEIDAVTQLQQARNVLYALFRYIGHVESPSMKSLDPQSIRPV